MIMPVNIFKHYDRAVHNQTNGKAHTCQCNNIDITAKQRDHQEGADDADGNGSRDH